MADTRSRVRRARNDLGQYDDLAAQWWRPRGAFAILPRLATVPVALVPPAGRDGAVLVDLGCGPGPLAPHPVSEGYPHVGVDLPASALVQAAEHGCVAMVAGPTTAVLFQGPGRRAGGRR